MADLSRPEHTLIIAVANQKGGVGKTTSAVNLSAALASLGLEVLVVDLDPQGNASTALAVPHHGGVPSTYEVLVEDLPMTRIVEPAPEVSGLWVAPATLDLAGAEIELVSLVARESRLKKSLSAYLVEHERRTGRRIDYVFIDCPPSLGLLTVNALVAANQVLLPIQCEYYALEGLSQLLKTTDMVRNHLNPELNVGAILLTMFDARTRLATQVADEVRTHFGERVLPTVIPRSVRLSEAPSYGQTIHAYDPASPGAVGYRSAAVELRDLLEVRSRDRQSTG